MRKLLLSMIIIVSLWCTVFPQIPTPTATPILATVDVTVSQSFLDDANAAFKELVALRKVVEKFKAERTATDAQKKASDILLASINKVLELDNKIIESAEQMNEFYRNFIKTQQDFITQLIKMVTEKRKVGTLSKLWNGLKQVVTAIAFIYIGKGISVNRQYVQYFNRNNEVIAFHLESSFWKRLRTRFA